jgi:hypothetical protein
MSGVRVYAGGMEQVQQADHPFQPLLLAFRAIHKIADQVADESQPLYIKGVYVLALSPELLTDTQSLHSLTRAAMTTLKATDLQFKRRMEPWETANRHIDIVDVVYGETWPTPAQVHTMLAEWLQKQFHVAFDATGVNDFFAQHLRDPQGKEYRGFFYFDRAWGV